MIKAVLFDLDGTLIDSAPDMHAHLSHVLKRLHRPELTLDDVKEKIGQGARKMVQKALEQTGGIPSENILDGAASSFLEMYTKEPVRLTKVYPGGHDLLRQLRDRGFLLGLCTNKPRTTAAPVLNKLELDIYFDAICCGDDVAFQKPDGRHITHTADLLNLQPPDCLMVGDSINDLAAARDAGIRSIMVSYGYDRHVLAHPELDLSVTKLGDVPVVLEELQVL